MKCKLTLLLLLAYTPVVLSQPIDYNYKEYHTPTPSVNKSVLRTTATEICNNNIDDDNNGLVDEKDFACYFNGATTTCNQSSVIWGIGVSGELYWADISTGTQHLVGKVPANLIDITWASNGKLYGCAGMAPFGIWEIDPNTANAQFLGNLPNPYYPGNAITADTLGNLYVVAYSQYPIHKIIKLNIATWQLCEVADLHARNLYPGGDLTFLNDMLYMTTIDNLMAKINVRTGEITTQAFTNSTTISYYGLASMSDGYLYVCDKNNIYQVDPVTMIVNNAPTISMGASTNNIYGLASYSELCQMPSCPAKITIQPSTNPPYCSNVGVQLKASIATCDGAVSSMSWLTADGTIVNGNQVTAIVPGKYYFNYKTTKETCNRIDSFTLSYDPTTPMKVDTTYRLPAGCPCTGNMTVIAGCGSGNYKYDWSTGATTATITNGCPGNYYTVKVTDINWLTDTTIQFYIPPSPSGIQRADITVSGDHCGQGDGGITITQIQGGTPPYQYALNNQPFGSGSKFAPLSKGTYTITIHDNAGCSLQQQVTVAAVPGPQKLWYTKKDAFCGLPDGTVIIDSVKNGSPPFSFSLDNGPYSQQRTFTNILPGQNSITIKDNYGCLYNEPFTILQSEALNIQILPKDTTMCASEKISFRAIVLGNNEGVQFSWDNGRSTTANTFKSPIYADKKMVVLATDKFGCTASDTAAITAKYCDTLFTNCVRFPNAFSPNRDGVNDMFGARHGSCEIKTYNLTIYNRWGQRVFQANNIFQRWNGTINGQDQLTDTYVYSCVWQDALGFVHTLKGTLALIR